MEEFKEKIHIYLKDKGISKNYSAEIQRLQESGAINDLMPYSAAQTAFLIHMSQKSKMFENLLKKRYLFDFRCEFDSSRLSECLSEDELLVKLQNKFKTRADYIHIEQIERLFKICIKFTQEMYTPMKNTDVPDYLYVYKLLLFSDDIKLSDFKFSDALFTPVKPKNVHRIYAEFIEHLKTLEIPLPITSDDLLFENTGILPIYSVNIYLPESSQWPKDQDAIDCAKAAFYCQLYLKSPYREVINKEYCAFTYKGFYFIVRILLKSDFNVKHKILMRLHDVIKGQGETAYRKSVMIKTILAKIGFYPLIFDDFLVDCLALIIGKNFIGDEKFLQEFLNFSFDLENHCLDLENNKFYSLGSASTSKSFKISYKDLTFNMILPSAENIAILKKKLHKFEVPKEGLLSSDFILNTDDLLIIDESEFDFTLMKSAESGAKEILGNIPGKFDLGTPIIKDFVGHSLSAMASFFYNPIDHKLMVKAKKDIDVEMIKNLIVNETAFEYIKD